MVYLVIKELSSEAEDVIMVTSSIMKDTSATGQGEVYRSNAIRALCRIIDVGIPEASPSKQGRKVDCPRASDSTANTSTWSGFHRTSDRAQHQDRYRRQDSLCLIRRPRLLLPPPPHRQGYRPSLAIRNSRGRLLLQELRRLLFRLRLRWWSASDGRCQHKLHDPISCHWLALPDAES